MTDRPKPNPPDQPSLVNRPSVVDRPSVVNKPSVVDKPSVERPSPDRGRTGGRPAETPAAQADATPRRTGEGMGLRTPSSLEMTPALRSHLDDRALRAQAGGGLGCAGSPTVRETAAAAGSNDRRGGADRRNDVGLDRRLDHNDRRIPEDDRRQAAQPFPGEDRRQGDRREPDADRRQDHDRREPGNDRREREPAGTDEPGVEAPRHVDPADRATGQPVDDTRTAVGATSSGPVDSAGPAGDSLRPGKADDVVSGDVTRRRPAGDDQSPLLVGNVANGPTDANGQTPLVTGGRSDSSEHGRFRAAAESVKQRGAEAAAVLMAGAIAAGLVTPNAPEGGAQARPHRAGDESGHVVRAPAEPRAGLQDGLNKAGDVADALADPIKRRREVEDAAAAAAEREDRPGKAGPEHQPGDPN